MPRAGPGQKRAHAARERGANARPRRRVSHGPQARALPRKNGYTMQDSMALLPVSALDALRQNHV
eukprot:6160427-Lingulodinium_polyedra.AAC.1